MISSSAGAHSHRAWRTGVALAAASTVASLVAVASPSGAWPRPQQSSVNSRAVISAGYQYGEVTTLDPAFNAAGPDPFILPIYDQLMQTDPLYAQVRPMLATSWAFGPKGRYLTLDLRTGVRFHDGSPVDAAAVKANIMRDKTLGGSLLATDFSSIASVSVVSKYVVRINLVSGQGANLPWIFASSAGAIVNPKDFGANLAADPPASAGSGPYVFSSEPSAGTEFIFKKAPGTPWEPDSGNAAELELYATATSAQGINAVQAGTLDFAEVALDGIAQTLKLERAHPKTFAGPPYAAAFDVRLELNPKVAPFNNALLRMAVQAALNPTAIAEGEAPGNACIPDPQPVQPGSATYDPNFVNSNPFNIANAKKYLAEAGMPNGFTFNMDEPNFSNFPASAEIEQAELAQVGITANLVPISPVDLISTLYSGTWQSYDFGGAPGVPDPVTGLFPSLLTGGPDITAGTPLAATAQAYEASLVNPTLSPAGQRLEFDRFYTWLNNKAINLQICSQKAIYLYKVGLLNANPSFPSAITNPQFFAEAK